MCEMKKHLYLQESRYVSIRCPSNKDASTLIRRLKICVAADGVRFEISRFNKSKVNVIFDIPNFGSILPDDIVNCPSMRDDARRVYKKIFSVVQEYDQSLTYDEDDNYGYMGTDSYSIPDDDRDEEDI